MFDHADYAEGRVTLTSGDLLVMYSDGMTEAENPEGHPFDELGLQRVIDTRWGSAKELGWATFEALERHIRERRLPPLPVMPLARENAVGV